MMKFTASSVDDVIRSCASFERMSGKEIEGKGIALQVRTGAFSWENITFRKLLDYPFEGPTEVIIHELDADSE
jgi:hypothetical protein